MNNSLDFYERVKALVKDRGYAVPAFLESLGLNYQTYKSARRLGNLPRANDAVTIANALETTVEYLVTGQVDVPLEQLRASVSRILTFIEHMDRNNLLYKEVFSAEPK